jgi:hypothetical protein
MPDPALDVYVESVASFRVSPTYELQAALPKLRDAGVRIRILDHPPKTGHADAAMLHVDLTEVPERFRDLRSLYRRTINGSALSIHRHLYSTLRLARGDRHAGPVIVKTVLNSRGRPELHARKYRNFWTRAGYTFREMVDPRFKPRMAPAYRVYACLDEVPPAVWSDERLMVERFAFPTLGLPIVKHRYMFLFDVELLLRQSYDDVLCTGAKLIGNEPADLPVPEAVTAIRRRLSLDYGSIDYFVVDGRAVVVDANKTYSSNPDWARRFPFRRAYSERVAARLIAFARG